MKLRRTYDCKDKMTAQSHLQEWLNEVKDSCLKTMKSVGKTVENNTRRSTNAAAEIFNSKLKGFRVILRGIKNIKFFLYRIEKLYS